MGKVVLGSSFHRDFCPIIIFLDYRKNYLVGNKTNWATWKYLLSKRVVWQDNKSYSAVLFLGYGTEIKFHDCGAVLSPPFQILLQTLLRWSLWESLVGEQKLFSIISNDVIFETKQNVWQEKMWKCLFIHCWKLVSLHISPWGQSDINLWSPTTWS